MPQINHQIMFLKKIACIAALSTMAIVPVTNAGSAHAIAFKITTGIPGPSGLTNQGAYSDFWQQPGTKTINFNTGTAPTTGFIRYSGENGQVNVTSDRWAPAGPNGEVNTSPYLGVFNGNKVTISIDNYLNYFGINWGAISANNTFSFYNGDQLIKSFTTQDVNLVAPIRAPQHDGQGNGYLHFYSEGSNDIFNKIIISQASTNGGGFESDNHSFIEGNSAFTGFQSVPEPSSMLGLLALGGLFLGYRQNQKLQKSK
jgi:hypothetical protein